MSDFKIFEYEVNTAKLPAGSTGPVFVMLADLHNFCYGPGNERLAEAIFAQKPDAALVAGDLLWADRGRISRLRWSSYDACGRMVFRCFTAMATMSTACACTRSSMETCIQNTRRLLRNTV